MKTVLAAFTSFILFYNSSFSASTPLEDPVENRYVPKPLSEKEMADRIAALQKEIESEKHREAERVKDQYQRIFTGSRNSQESTAY